jgi:PQQ-like domain
VAAGVPIIDLDMPLPVTERAPISLRARLTPPRPVLVVLVALATLAVLAAGVPPRRGMRLVLSAGGQPAAAFELSDGALFTASFGNNPNSESGVRRWDLTTGALSWAVALPQNVQNLVYDGTSRVLMARSGAEPKVAFLDGDTGEALWHEESPNTIVWTLVGGQALIATDVSDTVRQLRLADARTGRTIWSRSVDPNGYFGTDVDRTGVVPARVIAVDKAGHATVLSYADGRVLAQGDLGVDLSAQFDNAAGVDYTGASEVGDTLYISRRSNGVTSLSAWQVDTMIRRWQTTGGPAGSAVDCGSVVCMIEDQGVSAIDPATGRTLWRVPGYGLTYRYDARSLVAYGPGDPPQAVLLDPRTGRIQQRLGGSINLDGVVLRGDTVRAGRTWVEMPGPDGALHVAGGMDTAAPYGCDHRGAYLACPTTAGPTQVWQLPLHLT